MMHLFHLWVGYDNSEAVDVWVWVAEMLWYDLFQTEEKSRVDTPIG